MDEASAEMKRQSLTAALRSRCCFIMYAAVLTLSLRKCSIEEQKQSHNGMALLFAVQT